MANHLCKKVFLYALPVSHSTLVTNRQTNRQNTERRTTTMTIARLLLKHGRQKPGFSNALSLLHQIAY